VALGSSLDEVVPDCDRCLGAAGMDSLREALDGGVLNEEREELPVRGAGGGCHLSGRPRSRPVLGSSVTPILWTKPKGALMA
jgi:hypothetical protein